MCRLVKGPTGDSEIKRAQEMGLPAYPVFTHKHHSDSSYLACAAPLLKQKGCVLSQFATHNAGTIAAIVKWRSAFDAPFELQSLHGMGSGVYRELFASRAIAPTQTLRVYAPVGSHRRPASPIWCAACWRTAPIRHSCISLPTMQCPRGAAGVATACHRSTAISAAARHSGAAPCNSDGVDLTVAKRCARRCSRHWRRQQINPTR